MQVDLLDVNNYILVNKTLIKIFGLKAAAYCAELFTIVKKAVSKNKVVENDFICVDRNYIESTIGVDVDEQKQFEDAWETMDLLFKHPSKPDTFTLNVSGFVELISATKGLSKTELKKIKSRLKPQPRASTEEKKKAIANALKSNVVCSNERVMLKIYEWIDELCINVKYPLSNTVVKSFVDTLTNYTKDEEKSISIIQIAINNGWKDCYWAINSYERNIANRPRTTNQSKASASDVDKEEAF